MKVEATLLRGPHSTTKPGVGPVLVLSVRYALKRKEKENIASNCKKTREVETGVRRGERSQFS